MLAPFRLGPRFIGEADRQVRLRLALKVHPSHRAVLGFAKERRRGVRVRRLDPERVRVSFLAPALANAERNVFRTGPAARRRTCARVTSASSTLHRRTSRITRLAFSGE